ncbi:MAG: endonuclease/exonuclease/phosphatase family protein [Balneolaceae bacterium]|nr:endonuclease/exonuclease/phosphatase family protein [Balneolaceae bacterium]
MQRSRYVLLLCTGFFLLSCSNYDSPDTTAPASTEDPYLQATAQPAWYNPGVMDTIRIATWNVQHFVDAYDNPYIENEREDIPPPAMSNRRELLAAALRLLDADIVVFQEFESDSYLQRFAESYLPDMGYGAYAALESPDWYMNVVMMSRIPLGTFYSYAHVNTPIVGQTDSLGNIASQTFINNRMWTVDVLVHPDYEFTLTGLHLKAGRGPRNEGWRLGQVNLLRAQLKRLMRLDPDRNQVIVGDLNMPPDSDQFGKLLGKNSELAFADPLAGTGEFSHPSDSLFWRIDHILPNTHMKPELVSSSVTVARPLSEADMIAISDHLPVVAEFVTIDR